MKIGILETGRVNEALIARHGVYPAMFEAMYQRVDPSVQIACFAVMDGLLPDTPLACDAWLVTGSKHGVYDDLPWIEPLKTFLRSARQERVPLIGVCFGHQIMAEAFGGKAEKSPKGWGIGVHDYQVRHRPAWMQDAEMGFAMHAMHQDQVTALPSDATRLASSPFCENAMLSYGDPEAPDAISIQPHPEFDAPYAKELVEIRAEPSGLGDLVAPAMQSFGRRVANAEFARWSLTYIRQALAARKAA